MLVEDILAAGERQLEICRKGEELKCHPQSIIPATAKIDQPVANSLAEKTKVIMLIVKFGRQHLQANALSAQQFLIFVAKGFAVVAAQKIRNAVLKYLENGEDGVVTGMSRSMLKS